VNQLIPHLDRIPPLSLLLASVLTTVSCANLPSGDSNGFDDDIFIDEEITIEAPKQTIEPDIVQQQPAVSEEDTKVRPAYTSSRQYWKLAIEELQNGHEDDARWALEQALLIKPNSKIANKLMRQLDMDAVALFGDKFISYEVKVGDSLSKLAKTYLDDALQFYALAKYNGMDNPGKLNAGQVIKIPVSDLDAAEIAFKTHLAEDNASTNISSSQPGIDLSQAQSMYDEKRYADVIDFLHTNENVGNDEPELTTLLVDAYYQEAQLQLANNNLHTAKDLLLKASILIPDHTEVNMALIDLQEQNGVHGLYQKGLKASAEGKVDEAYVLMQQVLAINPNFQAAITAEQKLKPKLVDYYYRQALMFQRKQELDKSIDIWDKLLLVDNENENAMLYRAKAVGLKMKLEKLVSRQ